MKSDQNYGLCTALNSLVPKADNDFLIFIHDDMYLCPGWEETLINEINMSSLLGAVSLLDPKKLTVRVGIPIVDSQGTMKLLSDLSFSVLSMFQETLSLLEAFLDGSISSKEALSEILN